MVEQFRGSYGVTITPFTEDGKKLDIPAWKRFIDWQIGEGSPGIIILGTTGEFLTLTDDERTQFVEATVKHVRKRIHVLVGTMNAYTPNAVRYSREAEKLGAVYGNDVAKAAGDFNDNLKRLELASEAAKVSLVGSLLPALVSITNQLIEGRKAYGSFLSATLDIGLNVNPLKSLDENLTATVGQIRKARDDLAEMEARSKSSSLIDQFNSIGSERNMQKLRDQIALLEKRETFLRSQQAGQGNLGRGNINPGDTPKAAAPILDRTKDVKAPVDRAAKLYDELIAKITEKTTASQAELDTGEKLTASQQFALDVVTKLAGNEIKLTDAQKSSVATLLEKYLVTAKAAEAQQESMKAIQAEARQLAGVTESRQLSNKALQDGIDEIGLTRDQLEVLTQRRLAERIALEDQRIATIQLFDANATNLDQMKLNADALREELALRQQAAQKQAQLRQDPAAGAKQALDEYLERVKDVGTSTKDLVSNQLNGLEDQLATFFVTGKAGWANFFQSIAIEAAKVNFVRPLLAQLQQLGQAAGGSSGGGWLSLIGKFAGLFGGGSSSTVGLSQSIDRLYPSAKGNVFSAAGITKFAKGDIFDSPTLFKFAKGTGVMGEAGPEAIMPLRRGANGKLGVAATSTGPTNYTIVNQTSGRIDKVEERHISATDRVLILQEVRATVAADLSDPNSKISQGYSRSYKAERKRS